MNEINKKVLSMAAIGLLILSVFALVSTVFGGGGNEKNPIVNLLNSLFGQGGKYSKTPQVITSSGVISTFEPGRTVLDVPIGKVATVKITIACELESDEYVQFFYYVGKSPDAFVAWEETLDDEGKNFKTFEACTDHFFIWASNEGDGPLKIYYNYVITTEP